MLLAFGRFRGRRALLALVNTGMGLPPVVVGLVVTVLLWRSGPLGGLGLLFTPTAMVIAQATIGLPLVAGLVRRRRCSTSTPTSASRCRRSAPRALAPCGRSRSRRGCR